MFGMPLVEDNILSSPNKPTEKTLYWANPSFPPYKKQITFHPNLSSPLHIKTEAVPFVSYVFFSFRDTIFSI